MSFVSIDTITMIELEYASENRPIYSGNQMPPRDMHVGGLWNMWTSAHAR